MSSKLKPIAILIDGDNVPVEVVPEFLDKVSKRRNPIIKELFFNKYSFEKWELIINNLSLHPNLVPNNISGKNSADIALVISAMQIFYERDDIEEFYIISSDSDFAGLAKHIARTGKPVYGIGEHKTPESFQNACTRFWYIEDLLSVPIVSPEDNSNLVHEIEESAHDTFPEHLFVQAYERVCTNIGQWIEVNKIKAEMMKLDTDFASSEYRKTIRFIEKIELLAKKYPNDLLKVKEKGNSAQTSIYIRIPDCEAFKFVEAYIRSSTIEQDEWASLSRISSTLRQYPAYENGFSYGKSKAKKFSKVVAELLEVYGHIIEIREVRIGKQINHSIRVKL